MQRKVLDWQECGLLTVHWYEINPAKAKRVAWASRIDSRYEKGKQVLSTPPLLLTSNNHLTSTAYIINGKHRALQAYLSKVSTDAIIVKDSHELQFSTPRITHGKEGLEQVMEAFDQRYNYISICQSYGITTVADLAKKYGLHSFN